MIEMVWEKDKIVVEDQESLEKLRKNFLGIEKEGRIYLNPEEALYVLEFMNGRCKKDGKEIGFNGLASFFSKTEPRLFVKFNAFRDWRDRGLILKRPEEVKIKGEKSKSGKKYPAKPLEKESLDIQGIWYPESMFAVVEDEEIGKHLFNTYWFGQYGVYRQERGRLLKLNFLETVFLSKYFSLRVVNANTGKELGYQEILEEVMKKREHAKRLYEVYEDWRLRGFVVKTGFKFGSHFRIYFPGASPTLSQGKKSKKEWIHSKHVLHVFPKEQKLLISEWARAVRVAHSVRKTFVLSVPELTERDYIDYPVDFVGYRRKPSKKGWVRENPKEDRPRYLIVAFSEDDHIGGIELASLLKKAESLGLSLLLSITDRETAITYYLLNKITLPGSEREYYEIEWMKP